MARNTFEFYMRKGVMGSLRYLTAALLSGKNPDGTDFVFNTEGGGAVTLETPVGDVDGVNDEFVFSAPPIAVFRNGIMESRLGTVAASTFTFDTPPEEGDDIEGMV